MKTISSDETGPTLLLLTAVENGGAGGSVATVEFRTAQLFICEFGEDGGFTSRHRLLRTIRRYIQRSDLDRLLTRILGLKQTSRNLAEVAEQFRREGMLSLRGTPYTAAMLSRMLRKQRIHRPRSEATPGSPHLKSHEWWLKDLAQHLGMPHQSLTYWRKSGWFHARHVEIAGGQWIIWADESEIERLKRLRNHHQSSTKGQPAYPAELTKPKPLPNGSPL